MILNFVNKINHFVGALGIVRTSQVIDFEETKQLEFTVVAFDSGVPQLSSSAMVSVAIININDEDPKFEQDLYNASVKENSASGAHITVVKALDADEGIFGKVAYSLTGEHASDFNIGETNSKLDKWERLFIRSLCVCEIMAD